MKKRLIITMCLFFISICGANVFCPTTITIDNHGACKFSNDADKNFICTGGTKGEMPIGVYYFLGAVFDSDSYYNCVYASSSSQEKKYVSYTGINLVPNTEAHYSKWVEAKSIYTCQGNIKNCPFYDIDLLKK